MNKPTMHDIVYQPIVNTHTAYKSTIKYIIINDYF